MCRLSVAGSVDHGILQPPAIAGLEGAVPAALRSSGKKLRRKKSLGSGETLEIRRGTPDTLVKTHLLVEWGSYLIGLLRAIEVIDCKGLTKGLHA